MGGGFNNFCEGEENESEGGKIEKNQCTEVHDPSNERRCISAKKVKVAGDQGE